MRQGQLTYKGTVYPWHCDHMGHMNVMWYVGKFDEATWGFFASLGMTAAGMRAANRGMAAVDQRLTYQREALPGNTLEIYTRPLEVQDKTIRFIHEMIDCESGQTASTCELVGVHLDTEARKSVPLPDDVRQKLRALLDAD
ncbi:MAG: acyl-CoA thioesterase [Fimbriimonadaceae bacterium]|nr:acyl-CoA thioesterase [Alphaproteobacteria bacterium]